MTDEEYLKANVRRIALIDKEHAGFTAEERARPFALPHWRAECEQRWRANLTDAERAELAALQEATSAYMAEKFPPGAMADLAEGQFAERLAGSPEREPSVPWYVLDADGNPVPEPDMVRACLFFERGNRTVARDHFTLSDPTGREVAVMVSTVFLGIDHGYGGVPLLFETMVMFAGHWADYQERYATRAEALAGHAEAVAMVRRGEITAPENDE